MQMNTGTGNGITKTGGQVNVNILWGVILLCAVFFAGFYVGKRYEAGGIAKQVEAQAKADVKAAQDHVTVVEKETTLSRPFYEYKQQRDITLKTAGEAIEQLYKERAAASPRPAKSVTADILTTIKSEIAHEAPQQAAAVPAADPDPDVVFDADELRLYNLGNKKGDFAAVHPQGVSGTVP